ncbi:serine hydrolase domain-containing protein [Pontibacter toksunensis]|uniref:Serine hydrolase domain-containing protein n=1 Tax=Pontibacter toksunensis TaxID=1332631 RepID=A0ABW6C3M7_9BACT
MLNQFYKLSLTAFLVLLLSYNGFSNHKTPLDSVQNSRFNQLKNDIEKVIKNYNGLCAGLVLVRKDNPEWVVAIGEGKSGGGKTMSENTIFRTASISKMFVALAILKLQEDGQLTLQDRIKDIVPGVEFENLWEETHPVRIVHLLEHTTGWDGTHLVEMVHNQTPPIALKEALEFHPHSRKSRWVPGSRMSYCNSGYAVAAYIVEKVSGLPYEKYVYKNILKPLKMEHSTFFNDQIYKKWVGETYNWAMESVDYKNELYRPAAALNSSPKDMAQLLMLLLNRGRIDSLILFREESINRMEVPKGTPGAQAGLELGYGLGNFTSVYKGLTYHGHDGAMDGGLSQLSYLPEHGIGHVILLNANNAQAMQQIMALVRDFEVEMLSILKQQQPDYENQIKIKDGYYLSINPRNQNRFYQDMFINIDRVEIHRTFITRSWIVPGPKTTYYPISPTQFTLGTTNKIGLVEADDPIAGKVLYTEASVLKPISSIQVFGQAMLLVLWTILMIVGLLSFSVFTFLYLINREKYKVVIRISLIPTLTSLFIISILYLQFFGIENGDVLLSKPTFISTSLMVLSVLFVIGAMTSGIIIYKSRQQKINNLIYYSLSVLSCLHIIASIYLMYFGFIPLITWA